MTTLSPSGFLTVGASHLEYRMIGPSPENAPTIVMLHEGLDRPGCGETFDQLQAATGAACCLLRMGIDSGKTAAAARLHACRGARRIAKAARQDRLSPGPPA
jgi:hypothetical protein